MRVYIITTDQSDLPYIVVADNIRDAIKKITDYYKHLELNINEDNITGITPLQEYATSHIII